MITRKTIKSIIRLSLYFSLPLFVFRLLVLMFSVDPTTLFFKSDSIYSTVYNIYLFIFLCVIMVIWKISFSKIKANVHSEHHHHHHHHHSSESETKSVIGYGVARTDVKFDSDVLPEQSIVKVATNCNSAATAFIQLLMGFSFFIASFFYFVYYFENFGKRSLFKNLTLDSAVVLILIVFGCLSGFYFVASAFSSGKVKSKTHFIFSAFPVLFFAARLVYEYRDILPHINRNVYLADALFLICSVVFFMERMSLFTEYKPFIKPKNLLKSASILTFVGISTRLPYIVYRFVIGINANTVDVAISFLDVAATLYAVSKIYSFAESKITLKD